MPGKWLKPKPESGRDWLVCAELDAGDVVAGAGAALRASPVSITCPLSSEYGTRKTDTARIWPCLSEKWLKPRPESGRDWLPCAESARREMKVNLLRATFDAQLC